MINAIFAVLFGSYSILATFPGTFNLFLLKSIAKEKNTGILISIHDINTAARFAQKIALLPKFKPCIYGTPEQIMIKEYLCAAYNANIEICTHPLYKTPLAVF